VSRSREAVGEGASGGSLGGMSGGIPFLKGHGTGNDFVLLPDPDGSLALTDAQVRAITDRRFGIGGDGVLRAVPTRCAAADEPGLAAYADTAEWFMDYRNADGSKAEMCGNGARVFARHLVDSGAVAGPSFDLATRGGLRRVTVHDGGDVTVDMGVPEPMRARLMPQVRVGDRAWPATAMHLPNPHAVVFLESEAELAGLDLSAAPEVHAGPEFADGVNVEFAVRRGDHHVGMRVHERGVGETLSCGTGACAVMVAAAARDGAEPVTSYAVDVPGGALTVSRTEDGHVHLTGPAVVVASGELDAGWLARQR